MQTPPAQASDVSIIHSAKIVYILLYQTGKKLSKADKLGIHAEIEQCSLRILENVIMAYFSKPGEKLSILEPVRVGLETAKHLVRIEHELKIIDDKAYIRMEAAIIETSKMANGWIKYLEKQKAPL
jgi:hypothetical protein